MLLALGFVEEEEVFSGAGQSVTKIRLSMFAAFASNVPPGGLYIRKNVILCSLLNNNGLFRGG